MTAEESMERDYKTIAKNLMGVANNRSNFERLPDTFWGGTMQEGITTRADSGFLLCIRRMETT